MEEIEESSYYCLVEKIAQFPMHQYGLKNCGTSKLKYFPVYLIPTIIDYLTVFPSREREQVSSTEPLLGPPTVVMVGGAVPTTPLICHTHVFARLTAREEGLLD